MKIQKNLNSQDVKDSERFKTSLVSACFEAFCGPAKFQFSTDLHCKAKFVARAVVTGPNSAKFGVNASFDSTKHMIYVIESKFTIFNLE